jgi:hypothetical protein
VLGRHEVRSEAEVDSENLQVRGEHGPITIPSRAICAGLPKPEMGVPQKGQGCTEAHLACQSLSFFIPLHTVQRTVA